MKIVHISDTHGHHNDLQLPDDIDILIHSGDASNALNPYENARELLPAIEWMAAVKAQYKIYIAGNHDTSIEKGLIKPRDFNQFGIHYIENDLLEIAGITIWGSPLCPVYGPWSFMRDRSKLDGVWQNIPDGVDIVVTHTPPKGILDCSKNNMGYIECCGCTALTRHIQRVKPKLHLFGHIHNHDEIVNSGIFYNRTMGVQYSNGACVTDKKFSLGITSHGNILEI